MASLAKLGIDKLNVAGKRVLVRVDFNVPFKKVRLRASESIHVAAFSAGPCYPSLTYLGHPAVFLQ